jgi:hypothetical protein
MLLRQNQRPAPHRFIANQDVGPPAIKKVFQVRNLAWDGIQQPVFTHLHRAKGTGPAKMLPPLNQLAIAPTMLQPSVCQQ